MKSAQFVVGIVFPILLLSSWRVIAEEPTDPPDAATQAYIPVNEMLLTEDIIAIPQASKDTAPIVPGEIPVNDMLLTDDAVIEEELTEGAVVEKEIAETLNHENEKEPPPPFFSFLDDHQQSISNRLKQYTLGVDSFFSGSTSIDEKTGSYIRITLESLWPEGQGAEFDGGVSLKLHLPRTKKKLRLVVSNDIEEQKSSLDKETNSTTTPSDGVENSFTAALEQSQTKGKWKIRPSIGLKIRSPVVFYLRLRANRDVNFENWIAAFHQSFYWFDDETGFGSDTTMRWDRAISDTLLFRSNSFVRYTNELDYYEMSQAFSLTHTLGRRRAITYKIGAFGKSEPSIHATTYLMSALYRHNIHKDYLFLDVQPQLLFEQENDFKGRNEILVRLQLFYRG